MASPAAAPSSASPAQAAMAGPNPETNVAGEAYWPRAAKTAATIATPNTAPSWRSMLRVPDALPMAAGGTEVITALIVAGIATDTPQPASSNGATRCQ